MPLLFITFIHKPRLRWQYKITLICNDLLIWDRMCCINKIYGQNKTLLTILCSNLFHKKRSPNIKPKINEVHKKCTKIYIAYLKSYEHVKFAIWANKIQH